jgi:hypothetical protein
VKQSTLNPFEELESLRKENKELKEKLRQITVDGWKGKDRITIGKIGTEWIVEEHRKDKQSGEVYNGVHTIPEMNVINLLQMLQKYKIGEKTKYRELVPKIIELYKLPVEMEEFNGGRNRSKYYFLYYYYPIKILESEGYIEYGGRGSIRRIK